jgi:glycosyltransferase involved in cell wall biosynthesis
MNIGITVYPTYGGSGIVGSELGRELALRGHNVHFISSMLPTRLTELNERVRFHEVEMMTYPLFEHQPYDLALATKMATVARSEKLDLLHVHYAIPHSISGDSRPRINQTETLRAGHYNSARNGHHARRRRPLLPADYALRLAAVGRRNGGVAFFETGDD